MFFNQENATNRFFMDKKICFIKKAFCTKVIEGFEF
jgi:hypothetical protein